MYKRNPFLLVIILAYIMALMVYLGEPLMACEQSGKSEPSGVADSSQSSTSGEDSQQGMGSQNTASREGNGGDPATPLIDCSDPFWSDFLPCRGVADGNYRN